MSIDKRPNGKWRARYRGLDGREHSKHFDRKADAEKFEAIQRAAVARGEWLDPAGGALTVAEWAEEWRKTKSVGAKTLVDYDWILYGRIVPRWGSYQLKRLSHLEISQWLKELLDAGLRPATVRNIFRVLNMILKEAVEAERLPRNPAARVKPPVARPRKPQVLTHEQVLTFADAAGEFRVFVLLLAYTGLRWGEAIALRAGDFDLANRVVHVDRAFSDVRGVLQVGDTKNHRSREVPLPRIIVPLLERQIEGLSAESLAFTAGRGTPLRYANFRRKHFDPARDAAGLPWVTPHVLRHTAASLAIAAGADVKIVQAMLGHQTATMTLDTYADFYPSNRHSVADLMSEAAEAAMEESDGSNVIDLTRRREEDERKAE